MCQFRTISSSTFIILDVQSIYTPSQIQDWYWEDKILSKERQTVFFTAVNPMDKEHKDPYKLDLTEPRLASQQAENLEMTPRHGVGSIYSLLKGKNWSSIKQDLTQSSFTTHSLLLVYRKLLWWNLEIIYEKVFLSPRPLPRISFKDNWMKELDSEVDGSSKDT